MGSSRRDIILNVYDLSDDQGTGSWLRVVGMGMYHTGVEISGAEYTFGQNGVFFHLPKKPGVAPGQSVKLRESIIMGTHVGSANEVHGIINSLRDEFPIGSYNPTGKNCNHWSDALCRALVDKPIPNWINRPANIASFGGLFNKRVANADTNQEGANKGKPSKEAMKKKELTEEQKKKLEALKRQPSK